ncbi:MAG: CapA family protein [Solirubrobacterales bacterium]|nr:CapA family protein [Solirubrobacterales bacterium]
MLGRAVGQKLIAEGAESVWAPELRELLRGCELTIVNLECCISEGGAETDRVRAKRYFLRAPPAALGALGAIGADAASLANNHSFDYGPESLADTVRHLEGAGFAPVGAGADRARARASVTIESGGATVGIVACADHHFGTAAGEDEPGVALIQSSRRRGARWKRPSWLLAEVRLLAERCDQVLVFPHWGPNLTTRPAVWQRLLARRLLAAGADAVAGHSAHSFHGVGWRRGRPILYDLGDALHDTPVNSALRSDLGILALWRPGGDPEVELVGLRLEHCSTRLARGEEAEWIATRLAHACAPLGSVVSRLDEQRFAVRPRRRESG